MNVMGYINQINRVSELAVFSLLGDRQKCQGIWATLFFVFAPCYLFYLMNV